jgi:AraC-like DNA-binding protein
MEIVQSHIPDSEFSVAQFARLMGVSRSQLHQKLKEYTGQSASDFIRTLRLQQAAELLRQQRYTVSEIAYRCGFNDPKYFHRCFKEVYGVTPGNFAEGAKP